MAHFLRLLEDSNKAAGLASVIERFRKNEGDPRLFWTNPEDFFSIPGSPFAYWAGDSIRDSFTRLPAFGSNGRFVKQGLATADDFRFVRTWWEPLKLGDKWFGFAKGGTYSPFYSDVYLLVNWKPGERELWSILNPSTDKPKSNIWMLPETIRTYFFRRGITWPRRTKSKLSMRILPQKCIFADKGPAAFVDSDSVEDLGYLLAISTSRAFETLIETQLAAADAKAGGAAHSFEAGVIQRTPIPEPSEQEKTVLNKLARTAWSFTRSLDTVYETSHAFLVPAAIQNRLSPNDTNQIEARLAQIKSEIDTIAFGLYGLTANRFAELDESVCNADELLDEEDECNVPVDNTIGLLSWSVGIAFGRFDYRIATGERNAPSEPNPFDPLPTKSPGMLPDGADPFHVHPGILVDDTGHPHDLSRLIEEVLECVGMPAPTDVRRWLQRDFFAFHLQRYSKSRRKAPIYWPLSTTSGNYTLWLYYPSLSSQTLYSAINDFVEPKLKQIGDETATLRNKGTARSQTEEKQFEELQTFELELIEFRDTLLKIAQDYHPHHDDGVQITAAPLWPLFRHRPWQKVLKDTWAKLEKGDYDWAHLAMNYWPNRVREKCKTDKSLAIAHGLEEHYVEPEAKSKKARGKKSKTSSESNF